MKYDRIADIPIRHNLSDYVCTIGYSKDEGEFHFIAARYADQRVSQPNNGFNLYQRILREPALRATLFEALVPQQKHMILKLREDAINDRANNYGLIAGIIALFMLGYALNQLTLLLAQVFRYDTAEAIIFFPMAFAILIIPPTRSFVSQKYKRRYCVQHGHQFESIAGYNVTRCKRCGLNI